MFAKTYGPVKTKPGTSDAVGYMYVTNIYTLFGLTIYERDEILNLLPPGQ